MTDRLYYVDAYLAQFSATVTAVDPVHNRVVLDRTAFYPTSGGQPFDKGMLGATGVQDVVDRDDAIVHVVESTVGIEQGQRIDGRVDWTRRFDFMQQHTGQHLLSALCADGYGWPTTSVHFGDAYCTVDVAAPQIDSATLREIETRANAIITGNREVTVSFEDAATAAGLRKPSDRGGELRIIAIEGIDRSACGGTHVRRTGEIGCMLLRRAEKTKGATRIEFLCGARAVSRASTDADLLSRSARLFSAAPDDLPSLVESLLQRLIDTERERKRLATELARNEARDKWNQAATDTQGIKRIRLEVRDGAAKDAEPMAHALMALGGCIVLAVGAKPWGVMVASAADTGFDAGASLKSALAAVGGRGGGSPRIAQGSVADEHGAHAVAQARGF
jgi:alanyl-tRNA synthetase